MPPHKLASHSVCNSVASTRCRRAASAHRVQMPSAISISIVSSILPFASQVHILGVLRGPVRPRVPSVPPSDHRPSPLSWLFSFRPRNRTGGDELHYGGSSLGPWDPGTLGPPITKPLHRLRRRHSWRRCASAQTAAPDAEKHKGDGSGARQSHASEDGSPRGPLTSH